MLLGPVGALALAVTVISDEWSAVRQRAEGGGTADRHAGPADAHRNSIGLTNTGARNRKNFVAPRAISRLDAAKLEGVPVSAMPI